MWNISARMIPMALIGASLVFLAWPVLAQAVQPTGEDPLEQYAFSIGFEAYLSRYPLVITEVSRRSMLANPATRVNRFHHFSQVRYARTTVPVSRA
jgi:hypothetical protein